jgi:hypothetical protein
MRDRNMSSRPAVASGCGSSNKSFGRLAETGRWLAGRALSLADFAPAAHLSALDFIGDVDRTVSAPAAARAPGGGVRGSTATASGPLDGHYPIQYPSPASGDETRPS